MSRIVRVVGEFLKRRFDEGQPSNLYFWRNNTGDEIDLVIEYGNELQPIEKKLGQTFTADFLKPLLKWMKFADVSVRSPLLVYGGDEELRVRDIGVVPWRGL